MARINDSVLPRGGRAHKRRISGAALSVGVALSLVAAACGSDDKAASTSAGATVAAPSESSVGTTGSGDEPIRVELMWEVKGESDYGIDSMQNAAQLAIDTINANGGIDGRMIEGERIAASIVDVQKLTSQFLEAEGKKPDAIIGFVAPTVGALARQVDAAGIPILGIGTYPQIGGLPVGSKWFFQLQADTAAAARSFVDYAAKDLGAKKIAIFHTDESYGTESSDAGVAAVAANPDLTLVTNIAHSTTATDFTREVQEAKAADAIVDYSYPNPLAAQVKAFDQAGLGIPTISGSSASTVAANGLVSAEQLARLTGVLNCNPADDSRAPAKTFIGDYTAKYGTAPDLIGEVTYDAVNLLAAAIREAGSTDHQKVADALRSITFTDGACAPEWKADKAQVFNHQQVVVSYDAKGTSVTKATVAIEPAG